MDSFRISTSQSMSGKAAQVKGEEKNFWVHTQLRKGMTHTERAVRLLLSDENLHKSLSKHVWRNSACQRGHQQGLPWQRHSR
eukprot:c24688_g2_i1 orf=86-331(-)